jgi:DNA-binding protein HU-beta
MNKTQLIDAIAADANLKKSDAKNALEAFLKATTQSLKAGDAVSLVGFGRFSIVERGERKGRNLATQEPMIIPAKRVIKFKVGKDLDDQVN